MVIYPLTTGTVPVSTQNQMNESLNLVHHMLNEGMNMLSNLLYDM